MLCQAESSNVLQSVEKHLGTAPVGAQNSQSPPNPSTHVAATRRAEGSDWSCSNFWMSSVKRFCLRIQPNILNYLCASNLRLHTTFQCLLQIVKQYYLPYVPNSRSLQKKIRQICGDDTSTVGMSNTQEVQLAFVSL